MKVKYQTVLLVFLIFTAAYLRFYNLNWDEGHYFHPDERNIAAAVSKISFFNKLNPEFFAYGGFLIYLVRAIGEIFALITQDTSWVYDWAKINLIGRTISATAATLLILPVYALGRLLFNKKVGFVAGILVCFFPSLIQTAHFGVTESLLALFITVIVLQSIKLYRKFRWGKLVLLGLLGGIAIATKTSAISFLTAPIVALFFKPRNFIQHFLVLILVTLGVFVVFSPYTFLSWEKFLESMEYESGVVSGRLKVPYVLQFEGTLPYFFQIKNMFWQVGPSIVFGLVGFVLLSLKAARKKSVPLLVFLLFPFLYFLYVGSWYTKFVRYTVPVLPFLAIAAAWMLVWGVKRFGALGRFVLFLALSLGIFWGVAFFSIYTIPQTRVLASDWIYKNIPKGSKILQEHWDDGLPIPRATGNPVQFATEQLTIYDEDNQQKLDYYAEKLSGADYIAINSRRLYGTLVNLPERYPITARYYKLLFAENLGYKKIAEFSSYPQLLGIEINDDLSEETFQVYDHPKAIIFKNTENFTREEVYNILQ